MREDKRNTAGAQDECGEDIRPVTIGAVRESEKDGGDHCQAFAKEDDVFRANPVRQGAGEGRYNQCDYPAGQPRASISITSENRDRGKSYVWTAAEMTLQW